MNISIKSIKSIAHVVALILTVTATNSLLIPSQSYSSGLEQENSQPRTLGNDLFSDYIESTNEAYWKQAIPFAKKLEDLTEYAKHTYGEGSDMHSMMLCINSLYFRDHKTAPNMTAYTDTLWLLIHGVHARYDYRTGDEGRLHPTAHSFGAENGVNVDVKTYKKGKFFYKRPNAEDLDIMMLAMIFSRLTEIAGYGSHPLEDRLQLDNRDGASKSTEKLIRHRLRAYALQLMTGFIQKITGGLVDKFTASSNSYFKSWVSYSEIPSLKFFDNHNRKEIEIAYDNAFSDKTVNYPSFYYNIAYYPRLGIDNINVLPWNERPKKEKEINERKERIKDFLYAPSIKKRFIDLYIPAFNYINDLKHLITRPKSQSMIEEEERLEQERLQAEMKDLKSDIRDDQIIVGDKIDDKIANATFEFAAKGGGASILYDNQSGAILHRNQMLNNSDDAGAVIDYYIIDPNHLNLSQHAEPSADLVRPFITKGNKKSSVLKLPKLKGKSKIERMYEVNAIEKKLNDKRLILVSLGDPQENGIFVFAPEGTYEDNPHAIFKPIVSPSIQKGFGNKFSSTYPVTHPAQTIKIVKSIAKYINPEEGGGVPQEEEHSPVKLVEDARDQINTLFEWIERPGVVLKGRLGAKLKPKFEAIRDSNSGHIIFYDSDSDNGRAIFKIDNYKNFKLNDHSVSELYENGFFQKIDDALFYVDAETNPSTIYALNEAALKLGDENDGRVQALLKIHRDNMHKGK